jgi:DNA polymerase IV
LKIRFRPFETHTRAQTLAAPTGDRAVLLGTAVELLDRFTLDRAVRLLGVRFSTLSKAPSDKARTS